MSDRLVIVDQDDQFFTLTINRPEALNALNKQVFTELEEFFLRRKGDGNVKGVIITGAGDKAFVAGADIKEFASLDAAQGSALSKRGQDIFFLIERFHAPVIACVNGFALGGGCELAMACHMRIAADSARFGQPEVNLGLVPGYGGSQRLTALVGKAKSLEMLLTGAMINAEEALRLGLVNYVIPQGEMIAKAMDLLRIIATKAPLAIQECIRLVHSPACGSDEGYQDEYRTFGKLLVTRDAREGATAFAEKRKPTFTGN